MAFYLGIDQAKCNNVEMYREISILAHPTAYGLNDAKLTQFSPWAKILIPT